MVAQQKAKKVSIIAACKKRFTYLLVAVTREC
jgi:hypothetical protein